MSRTMAELLKAALAKRKESLRTIAAGAGVNHVSILRFAQGKQSLSLDVADKLARYFGIKVTRPPRRAKKGGK